MSELFNKPKFNWIFSKGEIKENGEYDLDEYSAHNDLFGWFYFYVQKEIKVRKSGALIKTVSTIEEAKNAVESHCQQLIINSCVGIEFNPLLVGSQVASSIINQGFIKE